MRTYILLKKFKNAESGLYYIDGRYYSPETRQFLSPVPAETMFSNALTVFGLNPYHITLDNTVNRLYNGYTVQAVINGGEIGFLDLGVAGNPFALEWIQALVGAIPDIFLGVKYLKSKGIHTKFAYSKDTRYMYPIMDSTWRWFGKSGSSLVNFGVNARASFKQILTGNARASFGAIAKSVGGSIGLNFGINAIFNLCENSWDYKNVDMWIDTGIDTAIGVSSYYLAAGTMSLMTAGLVTAGVAMPGIVVVGGVVLLSMGFEWLIREIFNYHQ